LFSGASPPRDISWLNYSWFPTLSRDGSLIAILDQSHFGGKLRPTWQLGLVSMRHGYFGFDVDWPARTAL